MDNVGSCWTEIDVGSSQTCNDANKLHNGSVSDLTECQSLAEEKGGTVIFWQPDVSYCHVYPSCEMPYRSPNGGGQNLQLETSCGNIEAVLLF